MHILPMFSGIVRVPLEVKHKQPDTGRLMQLFSVYAGLTTTYFPKADFTLDIHVFSNPTAHSFTEIGYPDSLPQKAQIEKLMATLLNTMRFPFEYVDEASGNHFWQRLQHNIWEIFGLKNTGI